jgi:ABC-type phosphonate transport system ATPase subunit
MVCLFNNNLGLWLKSVSRYAGIRAGALDHFPHEFSGGQRQRIGIAAPGILPQSDHLRRRLGAGPFKEVAAG